MKNVDLKIEAFRLATLVWCQSATAGKNDKIPTATEVLDFSKVLYNWFTESTEVK